VTLTKPAVIAGVTTTVYFGAEVTTIFTRSVPHGILAITKFSAFLAAMAWLGLTIKRAVAASVSDAINSALTTHTVTKALNGIEGAAAAAAGRAAASSARERLTLLVTDMDGPVAGPSVRAQGGTAQRRRTASELRAASQYNEQRPGTGGGSG